MSTMFTLLRGLMAQHRLHLLALSLVVLCNLALHQIFFEPVFTSDAMGYLDTARWMRGENIDVYPERILKPLAPFGIALLSLISGDVVAGMLLEVGIMYFLLAAVSYVFFYEFFKDKRRGFIGALLVISSYPMLFYGLNLFTETGAIFFYIAALLTIWKYLTTPDRRWYWYSIIIVTLGILWKEYSMVSGVFFGLAIMFHPSIDTRKKIMDLLVLGAITGTVFLSWQFYVYVAHQYSYLDWFQVGVGGDPVEREFTPYHIAKSLFATMLLAWGLVPSGLAKWRTFSPIQRRYILLLTLPSMMFFLWGYVSSRLYFIIVPFALLFALHGLERILLWRRSIGLAVVGAILCASYGWLFANSFFRAML